MEIRPALAPYVPLARMLAQTFGQDCEVVLHDLDCPEHSVVHVENPSVTGRKVGQSFDQLVRQVILSNELKEGFVANYYFTAPNGKRIRSSTLLIRDGDGRLTGALYGVCGDELDLCSLFRFSLKDGLQELGYFGTGAGSMHVEALSFCTYVRTCAISPDGRYLAVGADERLGTVLIYSLEHL